jgi:hypothetical protein
MAKRTREQAEPDHTVIWAAQQRQSAFIACPADDTGFGGSRGGGKTDAILGDWISHEEYFGKDAAGMAFRRERTQLIDMIERSKQILRPLGYVWHEQDKYWRGPKGGRLRFSYLESDSDADAYQGHNYTRLYPEEMGTFPNEAPINKLQATLRSGNGVPCQMKGTTNPGGPGHQWVKARYKLQGVVREITRQEFIFENPFTKKKIAKTRVFIPSKVTDNRFLGDDYVANLYQVGSATLVRAWLEGDWDVVEGAFFDCWNASRHVIKPFEVPKHWLVFGSFDWGSAKPYSYGLWAVSDGDQLPDGRVYPRGSLIRIREDYGASSPNVGLKLTAEQAAERIKYKELGFTISYRVADPAIFAQDGGPSLAERFLKEGVAFRRADNRRIPAAGAMGGWDQVRARLVGDIEGPQLYVFETCKDLIRTLPALQHDSDRPEDVDTDGEDHAPDEARYACMSRPYVRQTPELIKPRFPVQRTINEMIAEQTRKRLELNE